MGKNINGFKQVNKKIVFLGLTFLLLGGLFTFLILIFDPKENINIYSIGHIIILLIAGFGLLYKQKMGWIFSHLFSVECIFLYLYAILTNLNDSFFGDNYSSIIPAIIGLGVGIIIVWSVVFLNNKKIIELYNPHKWARLLTVLAGLIIAILNIYRVQ